MAKQLKRPNNAGCVYKLNGRRRNPWAVRILKGIDKNGKRVRQIIGYYPTKTDALKALAIYDIHPTERPSVTLCELYNEWSSEKYSSTATRSISKSTIENYKAAYKKLEPLYNKKFKDLRTAHFQSIVNSYVGKLKHSTLHKFQILCSLLYDYAMMNDIVHKNYAEFIILPEADKSLSDSLTDFEIQVLFNNDNLHMVKAMLIMMHMGFRLSVDLSLTIFDLETVFIEGKKVMFFRGGNKTKAGKNRPMPIPEKIREYLDYFLSLQGDTIICHPDGKPYTPATFRKYFYKTLDDLQIERNTNNRKLTPHCLKHTYATLLDRAGVKGKTKASLCGHSNPEFTDEVYTHKHISDLIDAANQL